MRELTVEGVRSADLTEADWMNGLEWAGEVSFKQAPCREAGDQGILLDGLANLTVFRQNRFDDLIHVAVQHFVHSLSGTSTRALATTARWPAVLRRVSGEPSTNLPPKK